MSTLFIQHHYVESNYLESLEKELADTQTALKNLVKAIGGDIQRDHAGALAGA